MKKARILAPLALLALAATGTRAETPFYGVLNLTESSRVVSLGGACAGFRGDPAVAWQNPAAESGAPRWTANLGGRRGFIDDVTWQALGTWSPVDFAVLALGFSYYDAGEAVSAGGGGTGGRASAQLDVMGTAGGALRFGPVSAGAAVKPVRSVIADEYTASTCALDAGVVVGAGDAATLGAVLQNAGADLKYRSEVTHLPTTLRAGGTFAPGMGGDSADGPGALMAAGDAVFDVHDRSWGWGGGLEFVWYRAVAIRAGAGVRPGRGDIGLSMGAGFSARSVRLDYAARMEQAAETPQSLNLSFVF